MTYLKWVAVFAVLLAVFGAIVAATYLKKQFVAPVEKIINEAKRFAKENTKTEEIDWANISNIREIEELGDAVNKMESDTILYMENLTNITAEKERIGTELALATKIQANMLPNIFPAFPEREEIDIFASMTPAKEVGGDFYDFFLIDEDHLGLVMADVSGKGVPAALFMMMSKNLVNNFAIMDSSPAKVLERVNRTICKNNENDMFVTVWLGILTISTGHVVAANAGHEYPFIKKANGEFEKFNDKHGFVIGGMDGVKYREYEFTLEKNDMLFLYTDGVPEATNANEELFGLERMTAALNTDLSANPEQLLSNVKSAVDAFVGEAPQFDDLTMLAIRLR
jgi:sigma-B regulation protein RsbU (phosphoserine phosphatase)